MAIFNRLTNQEIQENFTHYGMFCFIAPVYCTLSDSPTIEVRNWCPNWVFDAALFAFDVFCFMQKTIDPDFECGFPIKITGKIEKRPQQ